MVEVQNDGNSNMVVSGDCSGFAIVIGKSRNFTQELLESRQSRIAVNKEEIESVINIHTPSE